MKTNKFYSLAKSTEDIYNTFSRNKYPVIKTCDDKILEPILLSLDGLTFKEWIEKNKNGLSEKDKTNPTFVNIISFYNDPEWNLYELPFGYNEDYTIFEKINHPNSQFHSDLRQLNILLKNLNSVFNYIEPNIANKNNYGLELRNIILLSAMEVEVHWQKIILSNGYKKARLTTKDYVKLKEFINFDFEYTLSFYPDFEIIEPFKNWNSENPTISLEWYNYYNKLKHDRSNNLNLATLSIAITAVASVLTMLIIRYGQENVMNFIDLELFKIHKKVRISKFGNPNIGKFSDRIKYRKYFI